MGSWRVQNWYGRIMLWGFCFSVTAIQSIWYGLPLGGDDDGEGRDHLQAAFSSLLHSMWAADSSQPITSLHLTYIHHIPRTRL